QRLRRRVRQSRKGRNAEAREGRVVYRDAAIGGKLAERERETRVLRALGGDGERRDLPRVLQVLGGIGGERPHRFLFTDRDQQLDHAHRFVSRIALGGLGRGPHGRDVGAELG